ncbi:hypothetical protein L210DRAFT_3647386 [Boletus edulis BED1]|uniref:Uncharacterized protein n=1 Tax=Boletus edulis BED1 TaxID=1328754 RepID=A0AAD4BRX1_BOLED|nr:hypothetical protein L210DRAFT_3647386 [Boletus edulis BED1]
MPKQRNPPYMFPGDPGYRLGSPTSSDESYDEYGQPRWGGVGQGAPLDENGRYIYSQIGQPVVPSPPPTDEVVSPNGDHYGATSIALAGGSDIVGDHPSLKRVHSDDENSLPRTPQARRLGAMLTNTPSKFTSTPTSQLRRARKRPRLEDPFEFHTGLQVSTRIDSLEMTMKDLQQDVKVSLERQTELLSEILDVLRKGNPTS